MRIDVIQSIVYLAVIVMIFLKSIITAIFSKRI